MGASTTTSRAFALAGCIALTMAACSGQTEDTTADSGTSGGADSGKSNPQGGDDSSTNGADGSVISPVGDAGKTAKPKAIGSPCSIDSDCDSSLTCNTTFPGGLCTKTCAADAECGGKQGTVGACIDALCYAACAATPDGGAAGDDAGDAGKPKSPCKNKAFVCVSVAGESEPICMPGSGGDASAEASTDGSTTAVDAASD